MIKIISPEQYKNIPWKNGKGETIELAINEGGCLNDFDWRLSIASVVENGEFSDFSGYKRNLVLIKGNGIELYHNQQNVDKLEKLLSVATFDGSWKTIGNLISGPITDFNLMTKNESFCGSIETFSKHQQVNLKPSHLCFIYGLDKEITVSSSSGSFEEVIPAGHLIQILEQNMPEIVISGQNMLVVYIRVC